MRMRKKPRAAETPKQRAEREHREWQAKHAAEHEAKMKNLAGKGVSDTEFFAQRAKADASKRRGVVESSEPKPAPGARGRVGGIDTSELTLEQLEELRRREEAAQAEIQRKKARTGPVYNKGGAVYLSDDLLKDVQSGSTRRRS